MRVTLLTGVTILAMVTISTVAMAQGDSSSCDNGFAWGEWSVPINTILLILLALIGNRTRRKVERVEAVTDTVALRKDDGLGRAPKRCTDGE